MRPPSMLQSSSASTSPRWPGTAKYIAPSSSRVPGKLMALARVVTPNLPELAALGGDPMALVARTGAAFLIKGGHAESAEILDRLTDDPLLQRLDIDGDVR